MFFRRIAEFIAALYKVYVNLYFTYLEINPLVITSDSIYILDLAAKVNGNPCFCNVSLEKVLCVLFSVSHHAVTRRASKVLRHTLIRSLGLCVRSDK